MSNKKILGTGKRNSTMQHRIRFTTKRPSTVLPPMELPFPPTINPEFLVSKISTKKVLARFPNDLSPMISHAWKQESEVVKDAYTRLSLQAEKLYLRRAQFYSEVPVLTRPIAQRKIPPIFSSNLDSTNEEHLFNSPYTCSASTSPTMEFEDFFKTSSEPNNAREEQNNLDSANDNKFVPDCGNIKIPGFAQLVQENCVYDPFEIYIDANTLGFNYHHMDFFASLGTANSSSENYQNEGILTDFSPIVSS
ncbi:4805_t:CDS:2 [Ambispora leptoticha]|uniref:4805_t:CDS:1 n=1 Tax=Ambispora leptoticha TaxID=144679 RepID=A0A9N8ZF70_9GLOM|nr:4805_t:CDS:2 [Ambispora leptoticha]